MRSESESDYFDFTIYSMCFEYLRSGGVTYGYRIAQDHFQWLNDPWRERPKSAYELLRRVAQEAEDDEVIGFLYSAIHGGVGVFVDGELFCPGVVQALINERSDLVVCNRCSELYVPDAEYCVCHRCREGVVLPEEECE